MQRFAGFRAFSARRGCPHSEPKFSQWGGGVLWRWRSSSSSIRRAPDGSFKSPCHRQCGCRGLGCFLCVKETFLCAHACSGEPIAEARWRRFLGALDEFASGVAPTCRQAGPSSSDVNQVWVSYFLLSQRKVSLWLRRAIARRARRFLGALDEFASGVAPTL